MRAVRLQNDGLRVERLTVPTPAAGEALVRVHAAAITRDELSWPTDRLPATPSYELSGVVVETGEEVYALTPFDRDGGAADGRAQRLAGARRPRTARAWRARDRDRRLRRRRPSRRPARAAPRSRGR